MAKTIKHTTGNNIAITALIISILSLLLNFYFSFDTTNFERVSRSQELVDANYELLYDGGTNQKIMHAIKNGEDITPLFSKEEINQYIDVFEGLGAYYCQGDVYKKSLTNTFYNSLQYYCEDPYIFQNFKGKKNGSATLCAAFFPNSKFAQTVDTTNLNTCHFRN
ncbi:MAG: hypothetical protein AAB553_02420 [Patescibacteria group bacterium]